MRIRVPSKRVLERFHLTYELKGAQKGVDVLTEYYRISKMKLIVNGRKVTRGCDGIYFEGVACFTKSGLNKQNILHELYHHIVENLGLEIPEKKEEREAERFANQIIKKEKEL
jgi:hypothetical protein